MLIIDSCVRGGASSTRKYYESYLRRYPRKTELLELSSLDLRPLTAASLAERDALLSRGELSSPVFRYARMVRDADELLIAAPFWDMTYPSVLKVFLEQVCVCGVTFGYDSTGRPQGFCKASKMLYFSTCGGYFGDKHLGFESAKAVMNMLGVADCRLFAVQGLDIDPCRREIILRDAIAAL